MSRELYGALVGALTLTALLLPLPLFLLVVSLLSLLIGRELCAHLDVRDLFPSSFFSPLLFYVHPSLGGIYISFVSLAYGYRAWRLESFLRALFVLFYTGFFLSFVLLLKEEGTRPLLTLILGIWASDVLAYYVGKRFGRTPMFPRLSPKKTVEGFLGGLLAGTIVITLAMGKPLIPSAITGVLTVAAGIVGDYFMSFVKRQIGIKDFSTALGEHGGFADRFDSVLFSAPLFYWLLDVGR